MKRAFKLFILFVFILANGLMVHSTADAKSDDVIKLKFASWLPPMAVTAKEGCLPWITELEDRTNGRLKITYYGAGALGSVVEHYNLVLHGVADIGYLSPSHHPGVFPLTQFIYLPMNFPSAEITAAVFWEMMEKYLKDTDFSSVKPLWGAFLTPSQLHVRKKPLKTLEDFKGLKLVSMSPAMSEAIDRLGGSPVQMNEGDVFTALERGMVDGRFFTYEAMVVFKHMEVTKYRTDNVNFDVLGSVVVMNLKTWNRLPEDIKKIIEESSGMNFSRRVARAADNLEAHMKNIVLDRDKKVGNPQPYQLSDAERLRWKEKVMEVHNAWAERAEEKGLPGKALLQDIYRWIKKYSSS